MTECFNLTSPDRVERDFPLLVIGGALPVDFHTSFEKQTSGRATPEEHMQPAVIDDIAGHVAVKAELRTDPED